MKKKILMMFLAFLMAVGILPSYSMYAEETEKEISIWSFNSSTEIMEEVNTVDLYIGGELNLTAVTRNDISGNLQWQIEASKDFWVDIQGKTSDDLRVSYGLVNSLLNNDQVRIRCEVSTGEFEYHSEPVIINVTGEDNLVSSSYFSMDKKALTVSNEVSLLSDESAAVTSDDGDLQSETTIIYTVTIEYVYGEDSQFSGQRVALPYIAEVAEGGKLEDVTSPNCVGYLPDLSVVKLSEYGEITQNYNLTVKYSPAEVTYTVRHYQQNIYDDDYTWVDTTVETGYTESETKEYDVAKNYSGFSDLGHYSEKIAADSSTMIDIYYDRNYYLMSFNLDGGYGVEAIYARYGASIQVSTPKKAGYSFGGWTLDGVATTLPSSMPSSDTKYAVTWNSEETTYTVAYWLENPNDSNKYDLLDTKIFGASSGEEIKTVDIPTDIISTDDKNYYSWNNQKTPANTTVAGDGSTVINIYFDRNEYTLKFYYARLEGTTYDIADNTNNSSANGGTAASASWIGNFATKPTLDAKYLEQEETINGNTYYYFTITAKYGANLENLWPNAPLSDAGKYSFISWGTHYGSGYYANNSNKNIKGIYAVMDKNLIIDPTVTAEDGVNHWMVGYWNETPTMYTYEVYYSLLDGESADRTYNHLEYKKVKSYTVGSTDNPSGQSPLSFSGVTYAGKDYDNNNKYDGNIIRFYYNRNNHSVTFDDGYGTVEVYSDISFGEILSSKIESIPVPVYPNDLPDNAYVFDGWFKSKDGVGALDLSVSMPDEDLIYYARWSPKTYEIRVYDDSSLINLYKTEQVLYGEKATEPTTPTLQNSEFIGWYYLDEKDVEQRFDFGNMAITSDMEIYAKWRSNQTKQVEIHFVTEIDGQLVPVADTENVVLRLGQTRTFDVKTGSSLYLEYRSGYFPNTASHSITPTESDLENEGPIVYNFEYKHYGKVPYQVEFYVADEDGSNERPAFKNVDGVAVFMETFDNSAIPYVEEHWQNDKAVVTELYLPDNLDTSFDWAAFEKYLPNALKIQQVIIPDENDSNNIKANVIKFVYTLTEEVEDPDNPGTPVYMGRYLIQHYVQDVDNTSEYVLYSFEDKTDYSGSTVTASSIAIPGYTYDPVTTNNNMQSGNTLNSDQSVMTGTVTADDSLELNFYYSVNSYPYQVLYLEDGTNRVLHETKNTNSTGQPLTAFYGSKVTEEAVVIDGYDLIGANEKSIYIQMEAGNAANVNTITFYYARKSATLIVSKTVALDEEQAEKEGITSLPDSVLDQKFEFTLTSKKGFHKSVYDYKLIDGENITEGNLIAGVTTMTFALKDGQRIEIYDLAMDTYEIKETYVPGFRTSVGGTIMQEYPFTISTTSNVEVNFKNTYPFYTGDLVLIKNINKLDKDDPEATKPYKVNVTLTPNSTDSMVREVDRIITWTDADGTAKEFIIPKLTGTGDETVFNLTVYVPANKEVVLHDVPVGTFNVTEVPDGTGTIIDYYKVSYLKALHQNDEVTGSNYTVYGDIHGGHPTAVTYVNTYKKGDLTVSKTVTQEYSDDNWNSDTFNYVINGYSELPAGNYSVYLDGEEHSVVVSDSTAIVSGTTSLAPGTHDAYVAGQVLSVLVLSDGSISFSADPELSDGTYSLFIGGTVSTVTLKDDQLSLNLDILIEKDENETSWTSSHTIHGLPAGYYDVSEESSTLTLDAYDIEPSSKKYEDLKVGDTAVSAEFTNTYKRTSGHLKVRKEIILATVDSKIDTEQEFTFVVELKDGNLAGSYSCVVKTTKNTENEDDDTVVPGSITSVNVVDGKISFNLKHNEYILIQDLPVGNYTVSEMNVDGYNSSFGDVLTSLQYSVDPAVIKTNETTSLKCENVYPVYYANLIVKKVVETPDYFLECDQAPEDDVFTYEVTISDYSDKTDPKAIKASFYDGETDDEADITSLTVTDNKFTFQLKHNQIVDLNLPSCNYVIKETSMTSTVNTTGSLTDHYDVSYMIGAISGVENQKYALATGKKEEVIFTNTYKQHFKNLTIIRDNVKEDSDEQMFVYEVKNNKTNEIINVTVFTEENIRTGSVTIHNLPLGDYTVTQKNDWSWRYNDEAKVISLQHIENENTSTILFGNSSVNHMWLNGGSPSLKNIRGG